MVLVHAVGARFKYFLCALLTLLLGEAAAVAESGVAWSTVMLVIMF